MADNVLEIKLDADVAAASKAIEGFIQKLGVEIKEGISIYQAFDKKIKETEQALKAASDPKAVAQLTSELKSLQSGFSQIKTGDFAKGLTGIKQASGTSTQALTNLNRVVQDAPFGLIGIANNIEPLVQSFQKLKAESGGAGGAFKALGASLAGPTGILFGISAATSLLIAFGPEIQNAIFGLTEFDKAQQKAAQSGAEAYAKATQQFDKYLSVITDGNASLGQQKKAFEGANKLLDDYGLKINSIADFQRVGAEVGAIFAKIKQEEARSTFFAAQAAQEYAKQIVIQQKAASGDFLGLLGEFSLADITKIFSGGATAALAAGSTASAYANSLGKAAKQQKAFDDEAKKSDETIKNLAESLRNINGITEITEKSNKKVTKEKSNYIQLLQAEDDLLTSIAGKGVTKVDRETNAIFALNDALNKLRETEQKRDIEQKARILAQATGEGLTAPTDLAKNIGIPAAISNEAAKSAKLQADAIKQVAQATNDAQAAFSLLSPTIDAAFNSLANGTNIADAVGQAIKQLIINLIKAVAQAALLSLIFSLLPGGQAAAAAKGGFGGILKNLLGFGARGNAIGGPVSGGQGYIVGENGPELFVPGTPGSIVPNMALAGGGGGNVSFEIRGDVLYGLLRRTANNKMANFG